MKNQFKEYSYYYDLLYQDKNYKKESEYIHSLTQKYAPGAKTILNLGCGTGKHDCILAEKGYHITGVDLSETMIEKAKENAKFANSDIEFIYGDVRNIKLNKKFDVVISLFHVLSYQNRDEDVNKFFNTAKTHLKPNGIFIFDFWYAPAVLAEMPEIRIKRVENQDFKLIRIAEPEIHLSKNIVDVNYELIVINKGNYKVRILNETHSMRYFTYPELKKYFIKNNYYVLGQTFKGWAGEYVLK